MKVSTLLRFILLLTLIPAAALADPVSEMASFSVFGKIDLSQLANGQVKTAAGAAMSTPRYLSVQSCFVIPRAPTQVVQTMKRFDPTAHRELKVYLHSDLPSSPSAANFSKLTNPPSNSAVKALVAATEKMSPELQLSRAEAQKFSGGKPVFSVWTEVLAQRAQDFAAGGARAEAPYDHTSAAVQPGKEISGLVRQQSPVNKQFSAFLVATGLIGGKGSLKPDLYWELLSVEDEGVLTLGASYTRGTSGGYQAADGLYYASGGYYVALTLYQMWPVEIGGRPSTLVWRGDFISATSLGELHGVERIASEGAMKKDISKAVAIFKSEAGR
ncbi:MAG: hypothetical protein H0X34_07975 [Chthoniobacterales bacterium]|nr:hypothetical protein [Chthoniobacterales bacterium]